MTDQRSVEAWINKEVESILGRPAQRFIAKALITLAQTHPNNPEPIFLEMSMHQVPITERIVNFVKLLMTKVADIVVPEPVQPKQFPIQKEFNKKAEEVDNKIAAYPQPDGTITRGYLLQELNNVQSNYESFQQFLTKLQSDTYLYNLFLYDKYRAYDSIQSLHLFLKLVAIHSEFAAQFVQQKKYKEAEKEYSKALDLLKDIPVEQSTPAILDARRTLERNLYQLYSIQSDNKKALAHFRISLICQAIKDGKQKEATKWKNASEKEVTKIMQEEMISCDCPGCKKQETYHGEFKRCSRCKKSVYCSRDCQLKHWTVHKAQCVA